MEQLTTAPFQQAGIATIDVVPCPVILIDNKSRISFINKAGVEFFGNLPLDNAINTDLFEFLKPISETGKEAFQKLKEHINSENETQFRADWVFKKNGAVKFCVDHISIDDEQLTQISFQAERFPSSMPDETSYNNLFSQATDAIIIIDENRTRIIELNHAFVEHIGYSRDELLGSDIRNIEKEISDQLLFSIDDQIKHQGIASFEHTHIHKDGTHIPVDVKVKPIRFKKLDCYYCLFRDIASQKMTEKDLFEKTNLLNNVIQQSTEAVVVADNDMNILIWNDKATELLGIGSTRNKKASWKEEFELYNIDTTTPFKQEHLPLTKAIKHGVTSRNCEMYIKETDMYLSVNATPLYDEELVKIGGMAVLSDITATKKAEISVKQSEHKFRTLFENANDGIYIVSLKDGVFKQVNIKAAEMLGYSKDDLIGSKVDIISMPLDPLKKEWIDQELKKHGKVTFEHIYKRKSCEVLSVEVSAKISKYEDEQVIQYQARDISARKKAEADVQMSYKEILFTQNLIKAGEKGKSLAYLNQMILEGLTEFINPSGVRLYNYNPSTKKLSIETEEINPGAKSKLEKLSKIKIGTVIPDPTTNSFIQELLENRNPIIIESQEEKERFIREHVKSKLLKKLAPKVIQILKIDVFLLLPILFGDEVKAIIAFTISDIPKKDTLDAVLRYLQQANNVLNKIRFEQDLKISNEKYTDLVNNLNDAVISLNEDGAIALANNAAQKLFGYSQKELLKIQWADLVHPLDRDKTENFYKNLRSTDPNSNYIGRIIAKNGETKYVEVSSTAVFDNNGKYLGSRDIVRDITAKKLQERNKHVQQVLLENVAKGVEYKLIVHQALLSLEEVRSGEMLVAVYTYSRIEQQYSLIGCNSGNHEDYLSQLEFEGMYPKFIIKENTKGDYARFNIENEQVVSNYSKIGYAFPTVSRHLGIRGIIVVFFNTEKEITIKEIDSINAINNILKISIEHHQNKEEIKRFTENLEGAVERRTAELRNEIFERRIIEKELERSKDLAESASNAKTNFLANMSHEIRSPLNAILGFSQIMKGISEKEGFSGKSMGYLENIEMSSKNLSAIINDILDLSKIESGKLELDNEDFQLEQIIKNVYHLNKSSAKEKGIKFSYTLDDMLPKYIYGDRTKMMQVLMNLTSNAIKFTSTGKEVVIKAKKQSDRLVFLVEDQGIGIDTTRLESIFDPFEQEDTSVTREFGGSGLGLAISRSIVTLMQGVITVKSTKDKGSAFKVTLPLIAANPTNTEPQHEFNNLDNVKFDDNFKVLLVEDNSLNQDLVKALMDQINVELIVASNGLEGIEQTIKHMPSAILMDMHMPGMDGIETIKRIKENSETCNIPVIAYSADAFAETRKMAYEIGAVDYLTKPLDLNKLLSVLNRFGRLSPTELDFGNTNQEELTKAPNAQVSIPKKHKVKCEAHIKRMLEIPIFESEKLLEELDGLKALAAKNKINLLDKPQLIADAIYDGNEQELLEQLNSIL